MSDESISVTFPLDEGVFLRRQCPNCGREFKWFSDGTSADEPAEPASSPSHYYCPYCYEPAAPDDWWTDRQQEYIADIVRSQIVSPALRDFQQNLEGMNRPGSMVRFESSPIGFAEPGPLVEPDDMIRAGFPCHPEWPIKVEEEWKHPLACVVCGVRYPAELVKPLSIGGGSNE
jgi:hypothetical protein